MSIVNVEKYLKNNSSQAVKYLVQGYKDYQEQVKTDPDFMWLLYARDQCLRSIEASIFVYSNKQRRNEKENEGYRNSKEKLNIFKKNESEGRAFFRNPDNSINDYFWYEYGLFKLEKYF
jgi:hypothetical protein